MNDYAAYMKSPEWKGLRQEVIDAADGKCEFCGEKAVTAHHVRYPKGGYDKDAIGNLVACCWPCQEKAHGIRKIATAEPEGDAAIDAILAEHRVENTRCRNELCQYVANRLGDIRFLLGYIERLTAAEKQIEALKAAEAERREAGHGD